MNRVEFCPVGENETVGFFVVEETRINGTAYLLVTESEEEEADAYILKDLSQDGDAEACYVFVEDEDELDAVSKIFAELLEDTEFTF